MAKHVTFAVGQQDTKESEARGIPAVLDFGPKEISIPAEVTTTA